jgi:hypothetical protein
MDSDNMDSTAFVAAPAMRIIGAAFKPIRHRRAAMVIEVFAQNLYVGGAQLFARVGRQHVSNLMPIAGGRGFTGTLQRAPNQGDRLYLKYLGRLERSTNVVYRGSGAGTPVA